MKQISIKHFIAVLAICLVALSSCSDDESILLIEGTLPAELETVLQRTGRPYATDGGGGAYHPRQLIIQMDPGLGIVEIENFLFNILLIESYVPCMCGEVIVLATFNQMVLDQQGGLEGVKLSGESKDEIEEISFNYYTILELAVSLPNTINTADFNAAIETADIVIGMVDAGLDFPSSNSPMFGRLHTTNEDNINGADEDGNCITDDYIGWDFVNDDNDVTDDHSHGTHITNLIDQQIQDYNSVFDVNYRERSAFLPVKTHDREGIGTLFNVACGIIYAADHGADIINASWGFYALGNAELLEVAMQYAFDINGTIFVTSTGNEGQNLSSIKHFPSEFDFPYVFKVAAYDTATGEIPEFSNYYPQPTVNLVAPGTDIESNMPVWNAEAFAKKSGTSISVPYVTAAIAYTLLKCGNSDPAFIAGELAGSFPTETILVGSSEISVKKVVPELFKPCP